MIRLTAKAFRFSVVFIAVLLMAVETSDAGNKYGLFVGVNTYDSGLRRLVYAEKDAKMMGKAFARLGFRVITMTHDQDVPAQRPSTALKIMTQLQIRLKDLRPEDTVVIFFSGHGVQFAKPQKLNDGSEETHFFCPEETNLNNPDSMVPVNRVYAMIEQCAAERKLLLVDACRDQPLEDTAKSVINIELAPAGLVPRTVPKGILALYSCAEGEQSQEAPEFEHGAFCYHVLQYVRGNADPNFYAGDNVRLQGLVNYASIETRDYVLERFGRDQTPESVGRLTDWDLGQIPIPDLWTNALGMKFKRIPAGTFLMGSNDTKEDLEAAGFSVFLDVSDERPRRQVTISQDFHIGVHEVTQGAFAAFVSDTKYKTEAETNGKGGMGIDEFGSGRKKPEYNWKHNGMTPTENHPVINVSWNDAVAFVNWLNSKEKQSGRYRLPTEAEWEYCCRAGSDTRFSTGDTLQTLVRFENVLDETYKKTYRNGDKTKFQAFPFADGFVYTSPVGSFTPNGFGLHDMHGNVAEWCSDKYGSEYYSLSPSSDPQGPNEGSSRVLRGGSWDISAQRCRSAARVGANTSLCASGLGFRVVFSYPADESRSIDQQIQ